MIRSVRLSYGISMFQYYVSNCVSDGCLEPEMWDLDLIVSSRFYVWAGNRAEGFKSLGFILVYSFRVFWTSGFGCGTAA